MTWFPPMLPHTDDPEDVIRQIEDDPLTQSVWSFSDRLSAMVRNVSNAVRSLLKYEGQRRNRQIETTPC